MSTGLLYRLEYHLEVDDWCVSFDHPSPIVWSPGPFELTLENGVAVVETNERYVNDTKARKLVDPYLRSWGIDTALKMGGTFYFRFVNAQISDRETSTWRPPTEVRISQMAIEVFVAKPPKLTEYPPPPTSFFADTDVNTLWFLFQSYKNNQIPLAAMSYFCLTLIEGRAGGPKKAKAKYAISENVLDTLGKLTAIGDEKTGRKFIPGQFRPHTKSEKTWIEAAVKLLIQRAGEVASNSGQPMHKITMGHLPPLN